MKQKLVIGTRASKLALWQANFVADKLREAHPGTEVSLQHIVTVGDKILDVPLARIGGKGLFTEELEQSMRDGTIDLAVHSLKDMPAELPQGLCLAAVVARENARDGLISPHFKTLDQLPPGAKVGTSSLRRKAQLLHCRPDLKISDLRGNVDTRLRKLASGEYDAIVLAVAGLKRLGWQEHITQELPFAQFLPAAGQGVLAIEARTEDEEVLGMLKGLHDEPTAQAITAERTFLQTVEGSCQVPIGVHAQVDGQVLHLEAVILSLAGNKALRANIKGLSRDAGQLGMDLALRMLEGGGREILAEMKKIR